MGFCSDKNTSLSTSCGARTQTLFGSCRHDPEYYSPVLHKQGKWIWSYTKLFSWSRVFIRYCDGGAYSGTRNSTVMSDGKPVYTQGSMIIAAVLKKLQTAGLGKARVALFGGTSAGGKGVLMHCERVARIVPGWVGCVVESGLFLDNKGSKLNRAMDEVSGLHTGQPDPSLSTILKRIGAPLFVVQSLMDRWQLRFGGWTTSSQCPTMQPTLNEFRMRTIAMAKPLQGRNGTVFIGIGCVMHNVSPGPVRDHIQRPPGLLILLPLYWGGGALHWVF
eukprot:NODE_1651_length_1100_cov_46.863939_g1350_i0.p1 GENE.NODE_1651_length_1100_cov_46.863939_g1350_i0~~NODE_1651_length_1100_cov_46.863939_g1350_i0.p1  ORF type:complete len:283 (+),score=37.20 NODE_1651_length_1100_cov_46.863939_g1350_i0:22-849(+)